MKSENFPERVLIVNERELLKKREREREREIE
jgi:hypothetical protein